jgi:lambda repressor-like predicted transcriptional regulator
VADKVPRDGRSQSLNRPEYEALRAELLANIKSYGASQRSISLKLGHGEEWLNRILVGRKTVEWSELLDICKAIGVDPVSLQVAVLQRAHDCDR